MAEGFLRSLTGQRVFVASGGVRHGGLVHPLAVKVMEAVGVDISRQSCSSLESAQRQRGTYDVYVSIDAPYDNRREDRYQRTTHTKAVEDDQGYDLYNDPLLAMAMPAHWSTGLDAADARQRWTLWSPRDPTIFHETSVRKFQDDLYEGEPLFMRLQRSPLRQSCKLSERWEVAEVTTAYAMERVAAQERRFLVARDDIAHRCVELVRRLEAYYGEPLLMSEECVKDLAPQCTVGLHGGQKGEDPVHT